jgi:hypothetical protein
MGGPEVCARAARGLLVLIFGTSFCNKVKEQGTLVKHSERDALCAKHQGDMQKHVP